MVTTMLINTKVVSFLVFCLLPYFVSHGRRLPKPEAIKSDQNEEFPDKRIHEDHTCVDEALKEEIASYQPIADAIHEVVLRGDWKGYTWNTLAEFIDRFGARPSGSETLEKAIDYMVDTMDKHGLENVHTEKATVRNWKRGRESCKLLSPREKSIEILGLGTSVSTPADGIVAPAIVVSSFDELEKRKEEVPGKIIVFNQEYTSYGDTVTYRMHSAAKAAALGGVASLIRSISPFSLYTPHTGSQYYSYNVTKIPTACITIEDASFLQRLAQRGEDIVLHLEMKSLDLGVAISRNTVGELEGYTKPQSVVLTSGHLDSWDVGDGAMDDGGGSFIAWQALALLKSMKLRPKRTMRAVLWTGEEQGLWGSDSYYKQHKHQLDNFNLVMESDEGTFDPRGLSFSGSPRAACVIKEVLKLMAPFGTTEFAQPTNGTPDLEKFIDAGVPAMGLINDNDKYFWFHHTEADTMSVEDPDELDRCLALWATASYIIADLEQDLPR